MGKMETDSVPFMDRSSSVPYYRDILKCYSTYEGNLVFFLSSDLIFECY